MKVAVGSSLQSGVSVIIPVKDRDQELRRALSFISRQTCRPSEVLIVDDGSKRALSLDDLPLTNMQVRVIRNDVSGGAGAARNRGSLEARGELLLFLDSDDAWLPTYVEEVVSEYSRHPHIGALVTSFFWCTKELKPYRAQILQEAEVQEQTLKERGNFLGGCSVLSVRRDVFQQTTGFPLDRGSEDYGLMLQLAGLGLLKTLSRPLALYVSPSDASGETITNNYRRQITAVRRIFLKRYGRQAYKTSGFRRENLLRQLSKAGRLRLYLTCLCHCWREGRVSLSSELTSLVFCIAGPVRSAAVLRGLARARASFRSIASPLDGGRRGE